MKHSEMIEQQLKGEKSFTCNNMNNPQKVILNEKPKFQKNTHDMMPWM